MQVLYSLKQDNPLKINQISVLLGRHRSTIQRWIAVDRNQGIEGLLKPRGKSSGAKRKIPQWAEQALAQRLKQSNNGFKSDGEIQQWLEEKLAVKAEYKTVYYMVRYRLKAKLKVVRPENIKQDQKQLQAFKKTLEKISD